MPTVATCSGCTQRFQLWDDQLGKRFKCPKCGGTVSAPSSPSTQPESSIAPPARPAPAAILPKATPNSQPRVEPVAATPAAAHAASAPDSLDFGGGGNPAEAASSFDWAEPSPTASSGFPDLAATGANEQAPATYNPFQSPKSASAASFSPRSSDKLPTLCKVTFILDVLLSGLSVVIWILGVIGLVALLDKMPELPVRAIIISLANATAAFAGLTASIALLAKQRWGLPVGYVAIGGVAVAMLLGLPEVFGNQQTARLPQGAQNMRILVIVVTLGIRAGFLALYFVALQKFAAPKSPGHSRRAH